MSIQGKGNLSYKKQNVQKQNAPHTGVKNITFAHIFTSAGETIIPFDSLVTPTAWPQAGLINPNAQTLLSAQLQVFKGNITVTSSARGAIQKSEYVVRANAIEFLNITSLANEVFEVEVSDIMITGNLIVDMQTIRVQGELADTETDFNIGYEFDVLNEEIIVFRDGIQMFRADNNDSSGATGNYYYVDTDGDGRSSLIRFFEASVGVEAILVASTGGVVDPASVSTFQQIESLQGQLDAIVPTVAALAGVPETNFRAGPNNVDLKSFGDLLLSMLNVEVPIQENWQSFTPTSPTLTYSQLEGRYKRVGDSALIKIVGVYSGGTGGIQFGFSEIGTADPTKYPQGVTNNFYGSGAKVDAGANTAYAILPYIFDDLIRFYVHDGSAITVTNATYFIMAIGDKVNLEITVPIQGWESTETIRQKLGL